MSSYAQTDWDWFYPLTFEWYIRLGHINRSLALRTIRGNFTHSHALIYFLALLQVSSPSTNHKSIAFVVASKPWKVPIVPDLNSRYPVVDGFEFEFEPNYADLESVPHCRICLRDQMLPLTFTWFRPLHHRSSIDHNLESCKACNHSLIYTLQSIWNSSNG